MKKWKEYLKEIRQEEKRYGSDISCGISEEEAEIFKKTVKDELGIALPEEYLKILTTINGIEYKGFILYGADELLLNEAPNQHINGLIDCNKVLYENEWQKQYLFLGEGSISWYVYDLNTKRYCELDNPSGELGEEFDDLEQMLDKMVEDALT